MKNRAAQALVVLTVLFGVFTLGFAFGRGRPVANVTVSVSKAAFSPEQAPTEPSEVTFPLDINTATAEELMALPTVGQTLAKRILDYRERHGGFQSVDELLQIYGLGENHYAEIKAYVTVNPASAAIQ